MPNRVAVTVLRSHRIWLPPIAGGAPIALPVSLGMNVQNNLSATARTGTSVTASGTTHTMGSWTSLIDPTTYDAYALYVAGEGLSGSGLRTSLLADIGGGPTGGGNERVLIPFLDFGYAQTIGNGGMANGWYFPLYIPSGLRISARAQASTASDVVVLRVAAYQRPLFDMRVSRWAQYGAQSGSSNGTSVTAANGAFGSWTNVGATTARAHHLWHVAYDGLADTTLTATGVVVEIGFTQDGGDRSIGTFGFAESNSEWIMGPSNPIPLYHSVPAGTQLRARIAAGHAEARGIIIYGGD